MCVVYVVGQCHNQFHEITSIFIIIKQCFFNRSYYIFGSYPSHNIWSRYLYSLTSSTSSFWILMFASVFASAAIFVTYFLFDQFIFKIQPFWTLLSTLYCIVFTLFINHSVFNLILGKELIVRIIHEKHSIWSNYPTTMSHIQSYSSLILIKNQDFFM